MASIPKKPAPEETPITLGEASGLRITACKSTPDTARARADHRPGQRARQAEVKDNLPAYAAGLHEQGPPNLAQRQVDRARTDAEKKCQCAKTGQQGQRGQARSDPMAAIKMHRHRAFPQSRQTPPDSGRLA